MTFRIQNRFKYVMFFFSWLMNFYLSKPQLCKVEDIFIACFTECSHKLSSEVDYHDDQVSFSFAFASNQTFL